jgi:hypothetical protein
MKTSLRAFKRLTEEIRFRFSRNPQLAGRYQLPSLLNARGLAGTGIEVGVFEGWYSNYLLTHWRGRRLISVDPWQVWESGYADDCNRDQPAMDQIYHRACQTLQPHGQRSEIWRLTSQEASTKLSDASLDFVYIDAQHHEAAVTDDLNRWYPKLRSGGMLSGHDYMDGTFDFGVFGVRTAVDHFTRQHHLQLWVTRELLSPSWFLFKP